jgi:hypothetical protein
MIHLTMVPQFLGRLYFTRVLRRSLAPILIPCLFLTSSATDGQVVTRLQNGENLEITAIGTSLSGYAKPYSTSDLCIPHFVATET